MKILTKIWGIGLLALLLIVAAPRKSLAQGGDISEQDFYDNLQPYGTWISDPQYGDVWVPDVDEDFRPYATQGHWVLTEYGNTWVSDYPWGWATFHYGRWRYDDYYGWEWIPGYEWAPAWVSWRHGGGYYGWAPLMPGISISLSFGSGYRAPDTYWSFAPEGYINRPNIYNYYVPHNRVVNIINRTTIVNNTYVNGGRRYIAGPGATDIQRYTHQRPQVYSINNADRPGAMRVQNNSVNIFRPAVRRAPDARPARVVDANAYKQQNPNQGIARRGPGGAAGFDHVNASKLATVARNANADNNVVRVNPRPDNRPNPGQQGNRQGQFGNRANQGQPGNNPNTVQPGNQPNDGQPANRRGRPENRPNVTPPAQQPSNDAQIQQQQQAQRAQRQQAQPQPGQAQQQQQQAQRDQQRAQQQQAQQGQAQQQQQAQRDQQRAQRQQAQQGQAQQGQAQQAQQQQAQRDQQRAQQQQAQQGQAQQAQQQQQQRAQRQQAQQGQAQQQQQQAQRDQQRQQAQQQQGQQQAQQQQRQQQQQAQQQQRQQQQQQQQRPQQEQQKQRQPPPPPKEEPPKQPN
ncbi:DUF6600 domain-containing protein [Mucilaginibacter sp.]|uniref:DUF6600 domain-containing protein n=1 Tax=Mucilaginibacter sp. TaxID=1882438 RepID=UPI00261248C6|nr:DUF6600 domain-containing protein [Mucilaginibacter sp.]MDB5031884.1 hypothetical protein [Mucilaginibacter sp.]